MKELKQRRTDPDEKLKIVLAQLSGFFLAFILFSLALAMASLQDATFLIYDYQALIAGILALVGAMITVRFIHEQVGGEKKHREELRLRANYADRSALPYALTDLIQYFRHCIEILRALNPDFGKNTRIQTQWAEQVPIMPPLPRESVEVVRRCIQSADVAEMKALHQFLAELQIQTTRMIGFLESCTPESSSIGTTHDLHGRIFDALVLELVCSKIFDYARAKTDKIDTTLTSGEVANRALFSELSEHDFGMLYARINSGEFRILDRDLTSQFLAQI